MNNINIIIILLLSVYIIINTNSSLKNIFNNNIFKIIILFIIIMINDPIISILATISYIITIQNNYDSYHICKHEKFGNCLCGLDIKKEDCPNGQELIHVNGLKPFCGDPKLHLG